MSKKVLILDDDHSVAATMATIAKRSDFEVCTTAKADEFFERLENWQPTHVVVDLVMPDRDGMQVLSTLGKIGCQAAVIISSGIGSRILEAAARAASEYGLLVTGSLAKPFKPAVFRNLLNAELKSTSYRRSIGAADPPISRETLSQAFDEDRIQPYFQPQIRCSDGMLVGFEALARWQCEDGSFVPPDQFIQLAERAELIDFLTLSVARQALGWLSRQKDQLELGVAINLSPQTLHNNSLADRLIALCYEYKVPASRVTFEVTETSAMIDQTSALNLLTRLRVLGFKLSIDDFGTGYSSLSQLARLPFSEIKIDRSFVMQATSSKEARTIVETIISLARNFGIASVAEGVEDEGTLDLITGKGCDLAQGYFIARPMSGAACEDWIASYFSARQPAG